MLTQLIYRSRSTRGFSPQDLTQLAADLTQRNKALQISGLLLYDGAYFLQVLEGEEAVVDGLYAALGKDERHTDLVLLLRDPIPHTHFRDFRMNTLDVRQTQGMTGHGKWLNWGASLGLSGHRGHRSERIIEAFVRGRWRDGVPAAVWTVDTDAPHPQAPAFTETPPEATPQGPAHARFALQPIVHTKSRRITSVEALLRGPNGESPHAVLSAVAPNRLHDFDLRSKADAIALAAALRLDCTLSVNLLPMSLVANDDAVDFLVQQCQKHHWPCHQLLVEITEEEAITHFDDFIKAVHKLRASGIQVAIDDFGAGHAGLSLLADFQPDKLKVDKRIIQGVSSSGPRQAIVRSVIEFCFCLGITVVAEGVESFEDWCWLQSAGVRRFQGYLFARPSLQGMNPVNWPAGTQHS